MLYTVIIFISADMLDSGQKMEAAVSTKMLIPICQAMRCHISEDSFSIHHFENLKNPQYTFMAWYIGQGECFNINAFHALLNWSELLEALVWTLWHCISVGHNAFAETEICHVCLYGATWLSLDGSHLCKILYWGIFTKICNSYTVVVRTVHKKWTLCMKTCMHLRYLAIYKKSTGNTSCQL